MASSAKDIQLRELKDTITQLKTMISEQTELIRSLRLVIDEKNCDHKVPGSAGSGRERSGDLICCRMDDVSEVRQWTSSLPSGERLGAVWRSDQPHYPCQLDHLLFAELFSCSAQGETV